MATPQRVLVLVFAVLLVATSFSFAFATALDLSLPEGLNGRKFFLQSAQPTPTNTFSASKVVTPHQKFSDPLLVCRADGICVNAPQVHRPNATPVNHYGLEVCGADGICYKPPYVHRLHAAPVNSGLEVCGADGICYKPPRVHPPHAARVNNDFKVCPDGLCQDRGNKGFNRGGAVLPSWKL